MAAVARPRRVIGDAGREGRALPDPPGPLYTSPIAATHLIELPAGDGLARIATALFASAGGHAAVASGDEAAAAVLAAHGATTAPLPLDGLEQALRARCTTPQRPALVCLPAGAVPAGLLVQLARELRVLPLELAPADRPALAGAALAAPEVAALLAPLRWADVLVGPAALVAAVGRA